MELLGRIMRRKYSSKSNLLRNIGIIAHIDAGKTTTTERLIYRAGLTKRAGSVDNGDTVMDYLPEERERGITITSAAITLPWREYRLNLIDTPGHVDFTVEVERSLRVMDGAVVILDASKGVQAQTLTVWRQALSHGLKSFIYINKMDKLGADLKKCLVDVKKHFGLEPILLNEPKFDGEEFKGVKTVEDDIIKEQIAQYDDELLEKYVSGESLNQTDIKNALFRISENGKEAIAVLVGSSAQDIGTENLLNAIVDLLPPPNVQEDQDFKALAFKVVFDTKRNCFLVYCRIYSGELASKRRSVFNSSKGKREQFGKIMQVMADEMIEIESANAGQVVILTGLKHTATGDTLSSSDDAKVLDGIKVPSPVISVSLEAESPSSQDHLDKCLEIIQLEDPSARVQVNKTTGQTILSGMGELHLEILESRLRKEMKAQFNTGPVTIAFQEAFIEGFEELTKALEVDREVFGIILKGSVSVKLFEGSESLEIKGTFDEKVKELVKDAVSSAFGRGPIGGHRVQRNCKILIEDLQFSTPNSAHVVIFEALQSLLREAAQSGLIVLQEPLVQVEIDSSEQFIGDLMTDLFSVRRCVECDNLGNGRIFARASLRKMLGYSSWLRSRTGGMASFTMEASDYTNFIE
jgi:elongation factor G